MINVKWVLYSKSGNVIKSEEIKQKGNEMYLCQDGNEYQLLNEITEVDIERFFPEQMDDLINELTDVKSSLVNTQEIKHLDEILYLCRKCRNCVGSQIIFNPFYDVIKLDQLSSF
jgi:hypothetical protein